ncbi:hypothetical protein M9H77_30731 [Catharanthus roseus]|uniref:Uncharacterized protein n=1 Tax=Catharanthus roseus TaxID=4058 RepID=A0ACB9ZYE3_CATRO|nr:hypothetical protein M9H77_30731 [Catharanthus roseus]
MTWTLSDSGRWIHLRERTTMEGLAKSVLYHIMLCDGTVALWRVWRDMKLRCLTVIDYEMPELVSDDLLTSSGLCPWSLTFALHALFNSGAKATLICLDSLKLPNCARTPHIGSSVGILK